MSEDRLEKALEGLKNEQATPEQLEGAHARVWQRLETAGLSACTEFRPSLRDYLDGQLAGNRCLLLEDHLSRCAQCRAQLGELKGERNVVAMPRHRASRWPRWGTWAAAAALVIMTLYLGSDRLDSLLAPAGPRATVASITGELHRIPQGSLQSGASLGEGEVVRTGPGARAVLRLADGSLVEVNERSELYINAAWSGQTVHLQRGDIIVQAARQRRGHLRVQTRVSMASVKGTVFAVSAGFGGTVVSVVEGSVAVTQTGSEVVLTPGEQAASNPALASSVQEAISWSPEAENYITLLASFAKLDKQIAALPAQDLRTQARLLQYLPPGVTVYGAVPNLTSTIRQAMSMFEQESDATPVFREWWDSSTGRSIKQLFDRIQTAMPLLGDEIVFLFANSGSATESTLPIVIAEVQPGKRAELASAMDALRNDAGGVPLLYGLTDALMVVSDSQPHLEWVLGHLGQGSASPFAAAIAARYERGAGWILGMDIEPVAATAVNSPEAGIIGVQQMKHLFLEQRSVQGVEQNEVTLSFKGPRMGMASWLASTGSGGAAEYLSADSALAIYASTREPRQLFDELIAQLAKTDPSSGSDLAEAEARLGPGFTQDLASAFGTESAFGLEGLSITGPVWVMAALVNNPTVVDNSLRKLVEVSNAEHEAIDPSGRITIYDENVDGRTWTTMKSGSFPVSVTWTYDRGYLVAASDRGVAARAIATRNGGSPLVWSPAFQQQFPSSGELHPSGFAWLNTKGAFQSLAALAPNPALQKLMAERDPILVVFGGTTEQIHAAGRTRISGLLIDLMMLSSLNGVRNSPGAAMLQSAVPGSGIR